MSRDQGVDIIMNYFFGPAINSAAGKAGTICNAVNGLANNFLTAIKPPIVKAYSMGDIKRMEGLMIDASKYSYVCLMLFAAPFFFESKFVIDLWLKNPPDYAEVFCSVDLGLAVLAGACADDEPVVASRDAGCAVFDHKVAARCRKGDWQG